MDEFRAYDHLEPVQACRFFSTLLLCLASLPIVSYHCCSAILENGRIDTWQMCLCVCVLQLALAHLCSPPWRSCLRRGHISMRIFGVGCNMITAAVATTKDAPVKSDCHRLQGLPRTLPRSRRVTASERPTTQWCLSGLQRADEIKPELFYTLL